MFLDTLHIMDNQPIRRNILAFKDKTCPYILLNTVEKGRILLVHSSNIGVFTLNTPEIEDLFSFNNCVAVMTCYPKRHDDVDKLHLMYPECDTPLCQYWNWTDQTVTITAQ